MSSLFAKGGRAAPPPPWSPYVAPRIAVHSLNRLPAGGPAARKVWETPLIRDMIIAKLDLPTVAGMMRLSRASTSSVAKVLYRKIWRNVKTTRKLPRRAICCDWVRVLDDSLTPSPTIAWRKPACDKPPPHRFHPAHAISLMADWEKRFPRLHTVFYHYPVDDGDDAWVIRKLKSGLHVTIERQIVFDLGAGPFVAPSPSVFPKTLGWAGIRVRQTFVICVKKPLGGIPAEGMERWKQHLGQWKRWILSNPGLDERVTGVAHHETWLKDHMEISVDDALSFLRRRKERKCAPITRFHIDTGTTPSRLREFGLAFGPTLRTLSIGKQACSQFGDLREALAILHQTLPHLQDLTLHLPLPFTIPAPSSTILAPILPNVRCLLFVFSKQIHKTESLSRAVCHVGTQMCVFNLRWTGILSSDMTSFNKETRDAKSDMNKRRRKLAEDVS